MVCSVLPMQSRRTQATPAASTLLTDCPTCLPKQMDKTRDAHKEPKRHLDSAPEIRIGTGFTFQMRSLYSRIARSDENLPARATLSIDIRVQRSGSRNASSTSDCASTYAR